MDEEIMHLSVSMEFAYELTFSRWFVSRLSHDGRRFGNFWRRWFVDRPGSLPLVCIIGLSFKADAIVRSVFHEPVMTRFS